jgi:hypothetical protein
MQQRTIQAVRQDAGTVADVSALMEPPLAVAFATSVIPTAADAVAAEQVGD